MVTFDPKTMEPLVPDVYSEFKEIFEEAEGEDALPEHRPWDLEIKLREGTFPTFKPMYRMRQNEKKVLEDYVRDKLKKGHIRPSRSPAGYPVLFVPKPNKHGVPTLRMCVDYRQLNEITIKNRYPLPLIADLTDVLQGAQIFTAIDLRDSYALLRIKEGDEWKTAFRTPYGHFEYQVVPYGLSNAPSAFQNLVNDTLREKLDTCVVVYLDDILVYSKNEEQHVKDVTWVLQRLKDMGLKVKPEKCEWHKEQVTFLGYLVGRDGIAMDPRKTSAVRD